MTRRMLLLLLFCVFYSTVQGKICSEIIVTNCVIPDESRVEPGEVVLAGDTVSYILAVKGEVSKEMTIDFPEALGTSDKKCLIDPTEQACDGSTMEVAITDDDAGQTDRKCIWSCEQKGGDKREYAVKILDISHGESGTAEFQTIRFTETDGTGANVTTPGQDQAFELIVAVPPREILVELQQDEWEFNPNRPDATARATCTAFYTRPQPDLRWELGDGTMEIDAALSNETTTQENFPNGEGYVPGEAMIFTQTLDLTIEPWMDGLNLSCIANHTAYTQFWTNRSAEVTLIVKGPPVPKNETLEVGGDFTEGEGGILLIPFHSFPAPISLMFDFNGSEDNITVTNPDNSTASGRFTNRGWVVRVQEGNITNRNSADTAREFYAVLEISEVEESDAGLVHRMTVSNQFGSNTYTFTIPTVQDGGLSAGEIAGIVIGCLAAVVLIAVLAVLFIRHRNGKKSKKIKQERKRRRNEERQSEDNPNFQSVELDNQ